MATSDARVSLLDLPTELILQILAVENGLSSTDIYHVAFVSRRFLSVALRLFLINEGIQDPEEETSLYVLRWSSRNPASDGQPDALSALNNLPRISKIKHFRCFFQDPNAKGFRNVSQPAFRLSDAVARVSRFVEKLESIGVAEIYLVWDPYFISRDLNTTHVPFSEVKKWAEAFSSMLNAILERGCTSLTIQYDPSISPAFHFRSAGPVERVFTSLIPREEQFLLRWEFDQPIREAKSPSIEVNRAALLSSSAQAKQSITSLSIHSPVLLLPPFVNWTLSLLRAHHNLTSLSFAYISFAKEIWSVVLPSIADAVSTQLTELKFLRNCPHLDSVDLLQFIAHLPNLTYLSVDRTFRLRFQNFKHESKSVFSTSSATSLSRHLPRLLRLSTLKAPVELVSILLGSHPLSGEYNAHAPPPLPSLKDLTVYPSSLLIHPPSYVKSTLDVNELLKKFKSRSPYAQNLHHFALDAQMEFTDFRPVFRYLHNINTHGEFQRTLRESLSDQDVKKLTESGSALHICFDHITHLILYKFNPQHSEETPRSLCLWLHTLFPRVEQLTFTCRQDAQPIQDVHMDDDTIQCLIEALKEICHNKHKLIQLTETDR
ncbi:hypothetical protein BJ912DRAFT_1043945 [Pholiota molesta]|nr:hypothetical protein BJ912DRAFT_1043945 [Pholiota molesta]